MNHTDLTALLAPQSARIDQAMRQDLAGIAAPRLSAILEYAIFNGGKRVRPLLVLLAAQLCRQRQGLPLNETEGGELLRLALAFEYIHAASLLHDDVIDQSDSRRGRATANRVWDNSQVILAGDFLHSRALWLAGSIGGQDCLDVLSHATAAMVEAEFLQLDNASQQNTSRNRYFEVLTGKTALLIAAASESGAIFTEADPEARQALRTFGTNLGLTFQIVDDLLDYLGDDQKTGKAVGNDFQEGKMTLPLILALEHSSADDCALLLQLLHGPANERRQAFAQARTIIQRAGGFAAARHQAEHLTTQAVAGLAVFAHSPERQTLEALAGYVLNRER